MERLCIFIHIYNKTYISLWPIRSQFDMDLARAPRRARLTARKKGSGYENGNAGMRPTSFPGSSLLLRKDRWSRVTRKFDRPRGSHWGSRQCIKLHASTFALYTSIARSECFVPINFENHIYLPNLICVCF